MLQTYWCIVDGHIYFTKMHNTHGVYIIVAKNEKDAKKLLQPIIGFGSIDAGPISEQRFPPLYRDQFKKLFNKAKRGTCYQYIPNGGFIKPHHATDSYSNWDQLPDEKSTKEEKSWYLSRKMRNHYKQ